MCEQAPTFENTEIRFAEDTPIVIPCLEKAQAIFFQQSEDLYVFQALIYFISTLISIPRPPRLLSSRNLLHSSWIQSERVKNWINAYLRGSTTLGFRHLEEKYTIISRAHDWIVRCAFVLDIPDKWKAWLQLMYEKQPDKILDLPSTSIDEGEFVFLNTLCSAANIDGFAAITSVIKFWLRQALTIIQVWDVRLQVEGDQEALMPTYEWCVAAYEKMWHRLRYEVRNPLSEYPYMVRLELLRDVSFMRVFEECWKWVVLVTQGTNAQDFDPYDVRVALFKHVLTKVRIEFQPYNFRTPTEPEKVLGAKTEDGGYILLAESPVVNVDNLDNDLRKRQSLHDGLCKEFYPQLPNITEAEYETMYADSESDTDMSQDSDDSESEQGELELAPDVVLEAYGPQIDITKFTREKEPDVGDFCTWCQSFITLLDSDEQRCVVPVTCSDTFHAGCLAAWVNGAALNSNDCPNCKVQMTSQQRPRREAE